ncbi:MAG: ABC transporter permease [Chitinophagaceae bacterium]|jgi:ABC-type transport system involved in multi-copper enzyme maturation permease subunit|nr:ABC transporter permease [Chitinophagaceae bacterium]
MNSRKSLNYISLLKIEWLKIKSYRTFWVLAILSFISLAGISYIVWYGQEQVAHNANTMGGAAMLGSPFQFPDVWQTVSWISSFIITLPGLLVIILTTNEYNYKTHRQNIIDGISRMQFIGTKILLVTKIAAIFTILNFLVALLFGLALSASFFSFDRIEYIGYFFLQSLSYLYLALLFSVLFKRSGLAIALYILYALIIKNILWAVFRSNINKEAGNYIPLKSTDVLIPFPFLRRIVDQMLPLPKLEPVPLLIASFVYLFLFVFICTRIYKKTDL